MMNASHGLQSTAKVISAWPRLSSKGTTTYEIQLHSDGVLTCNCPGWINYKTRTCKHVKELLNRATEILNGRISPEFVKYDDYPKPFPHNQAYIKSKVSLPKRGRFLQVMEEGE